MLHTMSRPLFFCLCTTLFASLAYGTPLSEKQKRDFIGVGLITCAEEQRRAPGAQYVTPSEISTYCNCYMTRLANLVSVEEMLRVAQTRNPELMRPATEKASYACLAQMTSGMGTRY
jgi:hypothetical protein